jgi:ectoine hydroxylase-related dioxygenase (phytanoyl-CoA dioxygenase family)
MSDHCITSDFRLDGFALLESFVDKTELEEIQSLVKSTLSAPTQSACTRPHNTLVPLRWNDATVNFLLGSEHRVQVLIEALHANDLKWISGYVSVKEPHTPPLWWHQDWWCWDHPATYQPTALRIALLCYLAETNIENGALRVLPGSHLKSTPIHGVLPEAHGVAAGELDLEHAAFRDLPDQVTLYLRAGDAVVIDYRLLHGTHGNRRDSRRDCILLSFTPCWNTLPTDIKAHLIAHPAQPTEAETNAASVLRSLLPSFSGIRRDLPLSRNAPSDFEIVG